ncbi:hypothetical protein ACI63P_002246, partial [Neisseria gonorrhoeae]
AGGNPVRPVSAVSDKFLPRSGFPDSRFRGNDGNRRGWRKSAGLAEIGGNDGSSVSRNSNMTET